MSGYVGQSADPLKIKLLLAMGDERGGDACGLVWNHSKTGSEEFTANSKYYGYYSKWNEDHGIKFIQNIKLVSESQIVLGHNRKGSNGTKKVSHPFVFGEEGSRFYFMHNGTIKNKSEIAKELLKGQNVDLSMPDSYIIGKAIHHNGLDCFEDIVNMYDGAAAFVFYWEQDNNVYCYKGKEQDKRGQWWEERPLYTMKLDNGVYFASLEEQLVTLSEKKETIYQLKCDSLISLNVDSSYNTKDLNRKKYVKPTTTSRLRNSSSVNFEISQTNPQNVAKGKIYWFKGKYWKNGHLLNGCYLVDDVTGEIYDYDAVHVQYTTKNINDKASLMYFYKGVWLQGRQDLSKCRVNQKVSVAYVHKDSYCDIYSEGLIYNGFNKYFNSTKYIYPKFAYYIYKVDLNGNLIQELSLTFSNKELRQIINYNAAHATEFICIDQVKHHFCKLYPGEEFDEDGNFALDWGYNYNYTTLYGIDVYDYDNSELPFDIEIPNKYTQDDHIENYNKEKIKELKEMIEDLFNKIKDVYTEATDTLSSTYSNDEDLEKDYDRLEVMYKLLLDDSFADELIRTNKFNELIN